VVTILADTQADLTGQQKNPSSSSRTNMRRKRRIKKPGVVQKIIKSKYEPEKAQVEIKDAEHLYREIRVENRVEAEDGKPAKLKPGAPVEVTIEADEKDTVPASEDETEKKKDATHQ
jgi:hypothetical protein